MTHVPEPNAPDAVAALENHLPSGVGALFAASPRRSRSARPTPLEVPATRRSLAEARPGGTRPISEARPGATHPVSEASADRAHSDSIARNDDPHGDMKLSGAKGLSQEREHESLLVEFYKAHPESQKTKENIRVLIPEPTV